MEYYMNFYKKHLLEIQKCGQTQGVPLKKRFLCVCVEDNKIKKK